MEAKCVMCSPKDNTQSERAESILPLSEKILELIKEVQGVLDAHFSDEPATGVKESGGKTSSPTPLNVLDEIRENQIQAILRLKLLHAFITSHIVQKIV
jgi:hypothetical protein